MESTARARERVKVVVVVVVQQQQYVGSKKPATDGRSDETELEFPLAFMRFVSRELVLPRRCLQMSRRQLVGTIACIISSVRHVDWTTALVMHYLSTVLNIYKETISNFTHTQR